MKKCVKCSKEIDNDDLFCGYCGINQAKFTKYIQSVDKKIHKERDKIYNNKVTLARSNLSKLEKERENEIARIEKSRWKVVTNNFSYNTTEGIVMINGTKNIFSDIKGAEILRNDGYRTITTQTGKSKKHASIGGAIAGGLVLGPVGAVVGGTALGKTKSKGQSVTNSIPVCSHIGVNVDINGFNTEIVLLNNVVDQSSNSYTSNMNTAQKIVDTLRQLSTTPVPKTVKKPEEEDSVLKFDSDIEKAAKELQKAINDKPSYDIPKEYYQ